MNNYEYKPAAKAQGDGSLFDDSGFDEMQKAKNYEIGFKMFRAFYYVSYPFAITFLNFSKGESLLLMITSFLFMGTCLTIPLIYAAKTSAAGVMNIRYAKFMSKRSVLALGLVGVLVFLILAVTGGLDISTDIMLIMVSVFFVCFHIFARRNMKVLEKMLKENDEEE